MARDTKSKRPDRSTKTATSSPKGKPTRADVSARAKEVKERTEDTSTSSVRRLSGLKPKTETRVEIKPAKGRPMLTWVGKKPLRHATAYPAQLVETFSPSPNPAPGFGDREASRSAVEGGSGVGLLFHGDNKDVLAYLLANGFRGKVKLIYIDPPFDSGADYVRQVVLREAKSKMNLALQRRFGLQRRFESYYDMSRGSLQFPSYTPWRMLPEGDRHEKDYSISVAFDSSATRQWPATETGYSSKRDDGGPRVD